MVVCQLTCHNVLVSINYASTAVNSIGTRHIYSAFQSQMRNCTVFCLDELGFWWTSIKAWTQHSTHMARALITLWFPTTPWKRFDWHLAKPFFVMTAINMCDWEALLMLTAVWNIDIFVFCYTGIQSIPKVFTTAIATASTRWTETIHAVRAPLRVHRTAAATRNMGAIVYYLLGNVKSMMRNL